MTGIAFAKYHGLGNDFLIVDLRGGDPSPSPQAPEAVRGLCDRRFGVGADGVLALLPSTQGADIRMRVLNADGSEAEMCGNGIRCVAKYLYDRDPALKRTPLRIETLAGILSCGVVPGPDGQVDTVTVEMGQARLTRGKIPMQGAAAERCLEQPLAVGGEELRLTAVSMGNPHVVAFVPERGAALRARAERLGPLIENHAWFPQKTNVELAHLRSPSEIELVVWERGCGITLACGTGACATAVAACLTGRAKPEGEITVHLLGGPLAITVGASDFAVTMRGPARLVYDAVVDLSRLTA
jgi:diaminopimelate epimerase